MICSWCHVKLEYGTHELKESIYLETTVVSYFTAKISRDIIVLAHQEITHEWWPKAVKRFEVFISEIVVEEARLGDIEAAKIVLNSGIPITYVGNDVTTKVFFKEEHRF